MDYLDKLEIITQGYLDDFNLYCKRNPLALAGG